MSNYFELLVSDTSEIILDAQIMTDAWVIYNDEFFIIFLLLTMFFWINCGIMVLLYLIIIVLSSSLS